MEWIIALAFVVLPVTLYLVNRQNSSIAGQNLAQLAQLVCQHQDTVHVLLERHDKERAELNALHRSVEEDLLTRIGTLSGFNLMSESQRSKEREEINTIQASAEDWHMPTPEEEDEAYQKAVSAARLQSAALNDMPDPLGTVSDDELVEITGGAGEDELNADG